jgi:hypothetical protein
VVLANARTVRPVIVSTGRNGLIGRRDLEEQLGLADTLLLADFDQLLSAGSSPSSMTHSSASAPAKCDRTRVGPRPNCSVVHGDHGVGDVLQKPPPGCGFRCVSVRDRP